MAPRGAFVHKSLRPGKGHSIYSRNREALLVLTAGAALLTGLATPAEALPFDQQPTAPSQAGRPAKAKATVLAARDKTAAKPKESEDIAAKAKGVLAVVISLDKQQLTLYSDGQPVTQSRVSTGTASHPTPTGVFSVIQKDRWHRSNIYDNAPMFYMQRITWSGVAMHQGIVPNQPASHGCIRLPEAFARQMWGITKLGARVIIARGEVAPVAIANPRLFTLKREPLEAKGEPGASADRQGRPWRAGSRTARCRQAGGNRHRRQAGRSRPRRHGICAAQAARTAGDLVGGGEVGLRHLRERRRSAVPGPRPRHNGVAEVPPLKPGPVTVFISRKEGKLFVRKGFEPMFERAGHVRAARAPARHPCVHGVGAQGRQHHAALARGVAGERRIRAKAEKGKRVEGAGRRRRTANQALERVTIPPEALDRISELMSPGASLIISDQGLGPETGMGTDFIVLTR